MKQQRLFHPRSSPNTMCTSLCAGSPHLPTSILFACLHRKAMNLSKQFITHELSKHSLNREVALLHELSSDSLVVDIGANVGWHTLVALSLGHRYYHMCVILLSRSLVLSSLFRLSLLSPPRSLGPSLMSAANRTAYT
jgi:hypothetical protein